MTYAYLMNPHGVTSAVDLACWGDQAPQGEDVLVFAVGFAGPTPTVAVVAGFYRFIAETSPWVTAARA